MSIIINFIKLKQKLRMNLKLLIFIKAVNSNISKKKLSTVYKAQFVISLYMFIISYLYKSLYLIVSNIYVHSTPLVTLVAECYLLLGHYCNHCQSNKKSSVAQL